MAIKKSQLYSTLWESCNTLRGSMDASQYKDYVLIVLFIKYLSDKARQGDSAIELPEGCSFEDFVALKQNPHIGEEINKKLEKIKEVNILFLGRLALPNFNDSTKFGQAKQMTDTLSKLIGVFENDALDFSKNRAADDDLLGDAYEYLMKNFAAESGKSKGQFYTPAEVSRVIAKVLGLDQADRSNITIYDPTCGSGSLLLRANAETQHGDATLYGQEKDSSTASLAMLNMLLHNMPEAEIKLGDTLNAPQFIQLGNLQTFNYCVANPPFSTKGWLAGTGDDQYHRWRPDYMPPAKNGDYAFLLHLIASMKPGIGKGACILPHGVLFRGNAEEVIRTDLVKNKRVIEGIIGLPANIFFGTGIPASIIVLNNSRTAQGIFFIDASEGYVKDGNKNRLREQDIRKIVDVYNARLEIPHYSRFVPLAEIETNGCNLNIPRYIEPIDREETQDLDGHLNGGISKAELEAIGHWQNFDGLWQTLLTECRPGYYSLAIQPSEVFATIADADSVKMRKHETTELLGEWEIFAREAFGKLDGTAKSMIESLACQMRDTFNASSVMDCYDAFGVFMDYALAFLQDDMFAIYGDSWLVARELEKELDKKDKVKSWEGMLIPKQLVKQEFFLAGLTRVNALQQKAEEAQGALEQFIQECADLGDDDPLSEIKDDDRIASDADCKKVVRKLKTDAERKAEAEAIQKYLDLRAAVSSANKAYREADASLDAEAMNRYPLLTEEEIKLLLVDRKWFPAIRKGIAALFDNILQNFASSLVKLHERYQDTLPELEAEMAAAQAEVHQVLKEMGFTWQE